MQLVNRTFDPKEARPWREVFLKQLAKSPNVALAARVAKVARRYVYIVKKREQDFSDEWDDIMEAAVDNLEQVAFERAANPRDPGGTTLIQFLLKTHRKEVYGERSQTDINVSHDGDGLAKALRAALGR